VYHLCECTATAKYDMSARRTRSTMSGMCVVAIVPYRSMKKQSYESMTGANRPENMAASIEHGSRVSVAIVVQ
jgi:hypothetical protein